MGDHVMAIRLRLAGRLQAARLAQGLSQQEAAALVFWTASKYSRLESGVRAVRRSDLLTLLPALKIPAEEHAELLGSALLSQAKATYQKYDSILSASQIEYFDAVAVADEVREVSLTVIPMMLRTPAYQSAVVDARGVQSHQTREDWDLLSAQVRGVLLTDSRPKCTFVIDESVLQRHVGGEEVMREQLMYLARRANARDLRVAVIPYSAGLLAGMRQSSTLLSWRQHPDEDLVAATTIAPARMTLTRDARTVLDHCRDFKELLRYASPPTGIAEIIDDAQQKL